MKKQFKCSCNTHILEIEYDTWSKFQIPDIWIGIYDIYNPKTGRKYKKPKLVADVQFLGSESYKKIEGLMKFLENTLTKWHCRRNK